MKKTLVLGASPESSRYSFIAITQLRSYGHPVIAVGKRSGKVAEVEILQTPPLEKGVDTVTLYLNPSHQAEYQQFILALKPKRVIFNPGTENPELEKVLEKNGIKTEEACTLVLLSTNQY